MSLLESFKQVEKTYRDGGEYLMSLPYRAAVGALLQDCVARVAEGDYLQVIASLRDHKPRLAESPWFWTDVALQLSDDWYLQVYQRADTLADRKVIAGLMPRYPVLRRALLQAWEGGQIDETAMLYLMLHGRSGNLRRGVNGEGFERYDKPLELLRALRELPWTPEQLQMRVMDWLQAELRDYAALENSSAEW